MATLYPSTPSATPAPVSSTSTTTTTTTASEVLNLGRRKQNKPRRKTGKLAFQFGVSLTF
jgi:hypothetical protein